MRFLIAIALSVAVLAGAEHAGRRAPGFALPDSKLALHDLADYRGKIVLLEFMQTDCPECRDFAPVLNSIQQKYGDKVEILAVANAPKDNQDTIAQYIQKHKISYPVLFDQGQMAYSYILKPTFSNPALFLIDENGIIRNDWIYGPFTRDIFEGPALIKEIEKVINSNSSKSPRRL
jgi:peroxiredoxin